MPCPGCNPAPASAAANLPAFAAAMEAEHAGAGVAFQIPDDPSILPAVYSFLMEHREWVVIERANGRLTLSRRDEDRTRPPGALMKALNFSRAAIAHAANGSPRVSLEVWEARMQACMICPNRFFDQCGLCGCYCAVKASWADQVCPDDPPRWSS